MIRRPPSSPLFPYTTLFRSLVAAMVLPFTPVGSWFGFVTPPPLMMAGIAALVVIYLACAELLKPFAIRVRSEEHTSELQSRPHLVCRLLLEKKNKYTHKIVSLSSSSFCFFLSYDTATPEFSPLSLHDALPISRRRDGAAVHAGRELVRLRHPAAADDGRHRRAGRDLSRLRRTAEAVRDPRQIGRAHV